MARLELIVQTLGQPPRTVALDRTLVVGRSRRTDLSIDDEEVGREQFRVGLEDGGAWIEAVGKTNQTLVDDQVVPAGMRRPLFDGTTIRVGRTTVVVRSGETTQDAPPPAEAGPEMTMVARGPMGRGPKTETPAPEPAKPPKPPRPPKGQDQTGGGASPLHTMPAPRPGAAPVDEPGADQTMQWQGGGYRPGQAGPPSEPRPPAAKPPAGKQPPPAAKPPAAEPPAKPPPAAKPPGKPPHRPTTIAVEPADIEKELGHAAPPAAGADVEARVHETLPRLFVKCDGMKRRVRLMQARNALGRAESVDVLLPNDSVSELHAEITFDGTTWTLRDRGSTNGSFVDGAQLRGDSRALLRHSLIGLGNVRAVFLCNEPGQEARDRRLEERATKLLVQAGRLTADAAREATRIARADPSQSIAEVLLMDTPLAAAEWATAVATARGQRSLVDALRDLIARLRPGARRPTPPQ